MDFLIRLPNFASNPMTNEDCGWSTEIAVSNMARLTNNPIRKIVDGMTLTPNPKKEMISLSIGDPTIFGNLPLSDIIKNAIVTANNSSRFNGYAPSTGYEDTRAAIAERHSIAAAPLASKDVIVTSGCSGALELAICALADPGQNILVPRPGFPLYQTLAESVGIQVKHYDLIPERSWEINLNHVTSLIDAKTACIVVNNPSNPCGSVFSSQHIRAILDVAEKKRVPIISDEVYADLVFSGKEFVSMASQSTSVPILTCGGIAKKYLAPGWRLGWILVHDRCNAFAAEVLPGLVNLSQRILGPNTLVQGALRTILTSTPREFIERTNGILQRNATTCNDALKKIKGLKPIMPSGSMYMMVEVEMKYFPDCASDLEFTQKLVTEQSVFCLPGQCFHYANYFRIVLTVPEAKVKEACTRIAEFCTTHYRNA